ncbi:MAG: M1 family aminopeptidase [Candidatus Bipolaricaulota bacterium]|nr:M1 family aminopeptidase [Candidatus Bipolaricaulota bacterium]
MKKRTLIPLWLLILIWCSWASHALPNEIEYSIVAQLDVSKNVIVATQTVRFTNRTGTALSELYFHVVPNAFKRGANSKYQQDLRRAGISPDAIYANPQSDAFLEVKSVRANSQELTFTVNDTLMRVPLAQPLPDGATLTLQMDFVNDLLEASPRNLFAGSLAVRSGHRNGTYTIALWYPKVVVYDADEGWNLDLYGLIGEFYGDFANYTVELRVPADFVVGSTGAIVGETVVGDQRLLTIRAERVRDFAWVASRAYRVQESALSESLKLRVLSLGLSMNAIATDAMNFFTERFGPYLYPVMTVAQVTVGGGMEYPGIVMIAGGSETEIVHELAHQWWYAMVGNDEMDEAWLDEGFTTFSEELYQIERRGRPSSVRSSYDFREPGIPVLTRAERFPTLSLYFQTVYTKGSGILWMLRGVLGREVFDRALREYYRRWRLKNATTSDFIRVIEEISERKFDLFFDFWLRTTKTLDFAIPVATVTARPDGQFETRLTLVRQGELAVPVRVVLTLRDGSQVETRWLNEQSSEIVLFTSRVAPLHAEINPDRDVLEENRANNRLSFPANSQ